MACNKYLFTIYFLIAYHSQCIMGSAPTWKYNSTTPDLREIMIGRCWEYQRLVLSKSQHDSPLAVNVDCSELWRVLNETIAYKNPCAITAASYDKLFELFNNGKDLKDQVMFWSKTNEIAHDFTHINRKLKTLEDTFPGYIANELNWCTCTKCETGYNTHVQCSRKCNPNYQYWIKASTNFAEKASGTVYVMLNGTTEKRNAYANTSLFGRSELPTMGKLGKVNKIIVYNLFSLRTDFKREICGTETFKGLVDDANTYNITNVECVDDPREVRFILCAKYPQAPECQFASEVVNKGSTLFLTGSMMLTVFLGMVIA